MSHLSRPRELNFLQQCFFFSFMHHSVCRLKTPSRVMISVWSGCITSHSNRTQIILMSFYSFPDRLVQIGTKVCRGQEFTIKPTTCLLSPHLASACLFSATCISHFPCCVSPLSTCPPASAWLSASFSLSSPLPYSFSCISSCLLSAWPSASCCLSVWLSFFPPFLSTFLLFLSFFPSP